MVNIPEYPNPILADDFPTDDDGFIPVTEYAVLWAPAIKKPPDKAEKQEDKVTSKKGVVYIWSDRIPNHYSGSGSCPTPGCTELHGWTSFYVDDPQELSTIIDILRNEHGIRFRPSDYAIKSDWKPTNPKSTGGSI
jgi:hypothetical protein